VHAPARLLIALLAVAQLVLAPLAASAPCAWFGGGLDCCCAPAESEEPSGCCAEDRVESERGGSPAAEEPGAPCACEPAPGPPPAEVPDLEVGEALLAAPVLRSAPRVDALPGEADAVALRARCPGGGPPPRVRHQVFRL
jgi:hypothetical protein